MVGASDTMGINTQSGEFQQSKEGAWARMDQLGKGDGAVLQLGN